MSSQRKAVFTDKAPPLRPPQFPFSQAIIHNGMVYCSGNVGMDPSTKEIISGTVTDRTVGTILTVIHEALLTKINSLKHFAIYLLYLRLLDQA